VGLEIQPLLPGLVPELECREAAVYVHVPWSEWIELDARDRASAVAHYRTQLLIKAHIDDASSKAHERAVHKRGRKR
jgi:hypothetical protein